MSTEQHQGYTNYATFGVAVTLENDRKMSDHLRAMVERAKSCAPHDPNVASGIWTVAETTRFRLSEAIKDYVERLAESRETAPMQAQLIQAGLSEVDWVDIANVELRRSEEV